MTDPKDVEVRKTDEEWRASLAPEQYEVLRRHGTERAGTSPFNHEKRAGAFLCAGCGTALFSSDTKYESGSGWPSFYAPVDGAVGTTTDRSHVMTRTEVHCRRCGGHLGHVFEDGPAPTGLRYCMNGVALKFKPGKSLAVPTPDRALPGRAMPMRVSSRHVVLDAPTQAPFPAGLEQAIFGLGCFWGAERKFWQVPGVFTTAVGYAGGSTENPTYEEVCSGRTGHTEAVLVVFDPTKVSYDALLTVFWENHDPTQGMRQGNDVGTQYRSAIYTTTDAQRAAVERTRGQYETALASHGYGAVTTEIKDAPPFYYAEDYHQQYLAKNPNGYCGIGGTGVKCSAE